MATATVAPAQDSLEATTRERLVGVDAGRYVAVIAVMFIHGSTGTTPGRVLDALARFAVPFFFVVSGFFLSHPGASLAKAILRALRRAAVPFIVWMLAYLVWFRPAVSDFSHVGFYVRLLVFGGPAYHLWFLSSLGLCSVLLLLCMRAKLSTALLVSLAVALYAVGLLLGSYYPLITGGGRFRFDMRSGPFFGLPFMIAGHLLARTRPMVSLPVALAIMGVGGGLQIGETIATGHWSGIRGRDLVIGTAPFGIGAFLTAHALPSGPVVRGLAVLGRYSLGVFCSHVLVLELVRKVAAAVHIPDIWTFQGELVTVALVVIIATAVCVAAGQVRWLRPLVR